MEGHDDRAQWPPSQRIDVVEDRLLADAELGQLGAEADAGLAIPQRCESWHDPEDVTATAHRPTVALSDVERSRRTRIRGRRAATVDSCLDLSDSRDCLRGGESDKSKGGQVISSSFSRTA
jgi:hypothetical protein